MSKSAQTKELVFNKTRYANKMPVTVQIQREIHEVVINGMYHSKIYNSPVLTFNFKGQKVELCIDWKPTSLHNIFKDFTIDDLKQLFCADGHKGLRELNAFESTDMGQYYQLKLQLTLDDKLYCLQFIRLDKNNEPMGVSADCEIIIERGEIIKMRHALASL